MKGLTALFLGIFGTFAFSWLGLTVVPSIQIGHLDPQTDEEGNDPYPAPQSGLAERGRKVYVANGCVYCHSQQVRPDYAAVDLERKWGERRTAPRDYIFERTALLGNMRMGPDLANIGKRAPSDDENAPAPGSTNSGAAPTSPAAASAPPPGASAPAGAQAPSGPPLTPGAPSAAEAPSGTGTGTAPLPPGAGPAPSPAVAVAANTADAATAPATTAASSNEPLQYTAAWHHRHLYDPRSVTWHSNMPSFKFLYEKRRITGQPSPDAVKLGGPAAAPDGWEIVPTYDAEALVAYLMSLDRSHALKEVKAAGAVSPPAPGKAVK